MVGNAHGARSLSKDTKEAKQKLRAWLRQSFRLSGSEADRVAGQMFNERRANRFADGRVDVRVKFERPNR
jgi:hypothetical protein